MKPSAILSISLVVTLCSQVGRCALQDDLQATVNGNAKFAFALYREVAGADSGNLLISPWSVSCALAAAQAGADGVTASEIRKAAFLLPSPDGVQRGFGYFNQRLDGIEERTGLQIRRATAIWSHPAQPLRDEFVRYCTATVGAKVLDASFNRQAINEWVSGQTMGKVKDVIGPHELHSLSRLVLINALYFKGAWQRQFARSSTRAEKFTLDSGKTVDVSMMHGEQSANYALYEGAQVLQLPYTSGEVVMLLILPAKGSRLETVENSLSVEWFAGCRKSFIPWKVNVALPSFTINCSLKLNPPLQRLGMVKAFTAEADFSGIDGVHTNLFIDSILQKAFMDVNEQGTEAAVATAAHWTTRSAERVQEFVCDHPFLFMIYAARAGTILVLGRVNDPSQAAAKHQGI